MPAGRGQCGRAIIGGDDIFAFVRSIKVAHTQPGGGRIQAGVTVGQSRIGQMTPIDLKEEAPLFRTQKACAKAGLHIEKKRAAKFALRMQAGSIAVNAADAHMLTGPASNQAGGSCNLQKG